nr:probable LRR receptor-like serine/threonine-protein kinase At1g67720 isoform X2 [Ipomoea batatas]
MSIDGEAASNTGAPKKPGLAWISDSGMGQGKAEKGPPSFSTLSSGLFNLSMYATDYEDDFYLKLAARVNFGAQSTDAIRDVRYNSLIGEIPLPLLTGKVTFRYEGNSQLRHGSNSKSHNKLLIGVSVGLVAVLFILFIATMRYFRRKASRQRTDTKGNSLRSSTKPSTNYSSIARGGSLMDEGVACYISLGDIQQSTQNFSKRIGKGSFGPVYHGKLRDGKEIAVKVMADSSSHGTKQFFTEVALLSRIHHRNLVPLIGYYEDEHQCMLVYEYMHNGTLRDHIHDPSNQKYLDWLERLRIAEDAAKGLEYLHTGCNPSIIHRDVKTSNILLDINMRAKVSDFGLSRQAEEDINIYQVWHEELLAT